MSTGQTVLLGGIAGFTIFLGLPLGRLRSGNLPFRAFLNGLSAGILVFLLFEVLEHATGPVEKAVEKGAWGELASVGILYVLGIGLGLLGLVYVRKIGRRDPVRTSTGPGAMAVAEIPAVRSEALRLGMAIAAAIGLHNFSEGLAIGQAANSGEVSLALLLVIGFALHNATEGFGIIGPLAADGVQATWGWLFLVGLIGGGPTFLGTIVGTAITSKLVFVAFLALAAGAIIYVVGELFVVGRRISWDAMLWGVAAGFFLALGTELVLKAAGA